MQVSILCPVEDIGQLVEQPCSAVDAGRGQGSLDAPIRGPDRVAAEMWRAVQLAAYIGEGMFQWVALLTAVVAILSMTLAYLLVMLLILPLAWLKEKLI